MTKEEVLQRANDYCNERSYDPETLTDDFKDKFAEFFAKRFQDGSIDDENIIADLKFNLDTARSAALRGISTANRTFSEKETNYRNQIEELRKKVGDETPKDKQELEISKELQEKLDELEKFKKEEMKKTKFKEIVKIAKSSIRQDLHRSFETFAKGIEVVLDKDDKEQAATLVERFQEIFRDSIGDIKPLAPKQTQKRDEDFLSSLPKVKVI